jgi:hypothetical protein
MVRHVADKPVSDDYIADLRSLHERWTSDFQEAETFNPDSARQLASRLRDLQHLTSRLERRKAWISRVLAADRERLGGRGRSLTLHIIPRIVRRSLTR